MPPCRWLHSLLPANRRDLFLFVAFLLITSTQSRAGYEFSISASDTDPGVHTGAPSGGYRHLYLWLVCTDEGLAAFEAGVASTLEIAGFAPLNGVLNAGSGDDILLAVPGCPTGSFVLGRWTVWDDGGMFCLGESSTGVMGGVDCDPVDPELHDDVVLTGFSSSGSDPCAVGSDSCGATASRRRSRAAARSARSGSREPASGGGHRADARAPAAKRGRRRQRKRARVPLLVERRRR